MMQVMSDICMGILLHRQIVNVVAMTMGEVVFIYVLVVQFHT